MCRRKRHLNKGLCLPCRTPKDRRDLLEAGVPWGSANALAYLTKKCKAQGRKPRQTEVVLSLVHPILMENIAVRADGRLTLRSAKYFWMRRGGWYPHESSER